MPHSFTPGPWVVVGSRTKYVEARLAGRLIQEVAACGPTMADKGYGPQQEANARLIAAAPELLGALIALYAVAEVVRDEDYGAVTNAAAVIAKATGEQP